MKTKFLIPFFVPALFAARFAAACGNYYYVSDQPLPLRNGFINYHGLFVSTTDSLYHSESKNMHKTAYLLPVGAATNKWVAEEFREVEYRKLRDSLLKLIGNPPNGWKLSGYDLAAKAMARKADYRLLSDFAWKMARHNELSGAEKILTALEKQHPDEYNIIANLGTVYELLGKNKLALQYITKAVALSPHSHYGSEWLHINILKQKLNLMNRYDWHLFFQLNKTAIPYTDYVYKSATAPDAFGAIHRDTLMMHMAYQLHERMFFIHEKDQTIAEMLFMFMQCMIQRGDAAYAAEAGQLCMTYSDDFNWKRIFKALSWCLQRTGTS